MTIRVLARAVADPNEFTTLAEWRAQADVDTHLRTPHVQRLLAAPPDIRTYRPLPV